MFEGLQTKGGSLEGSKPQSMITRMGIGLQDHQKIALGAMWTLS